MSEKERRDENLHLEGAGELARDMVFILAPVQDNNARRSEVNPRIILSVYTVRSSVHTQYTVKPVGWLIPLTEARAKTA